jgi:hypothetical protein
MTVWYVIVISCISITCYVSAVRIQSRRVPSCFGRSIFVYYSTLRKSAKLHTVFTSAYAYEARSVLVFVGTALRAESSERFSPLPPKSLTHQKACVCIRLWALPLPIDYNILLNFVL